MLRYLVITTRTPHFQPELLPDHTQFLETLKQKGQITVSGAFTDHSGGLYVLNSASLDEALDIAHRDPIVTSGSSTATVYEVEVAYQSNP